MNSYFQVLIHRHASHTRYTVRCTRDILSITCCVAVSDFISEERPFLEVLTLLWELEDGGIEGRSEEIGAAITKE